MTGSCSQPVPAGMDTHHGGEALRFPHRGSRAQQGCQDQGHAQADPKVESWKTDVGVVVRCQRPSLMLHQERDQKVHFGELAPNDQVAKLKFFCNLFNTPHLDVLCCVCLARL